MCFPVDFAKLLRTIILYKIEQLLLQKLTDMWHRKVQVPIIMKGDLRNHEVAVIETNLNLNHQLLATKRIRTILNY